MLGPLMIGIEGLELLGEERRRLRHPAVGGVILFSRNFETPAQLLALTRSIKALRQPPLLIAVDQEGGRVQRFQAGLTRLPPMGAIGRAATADPALARDAAQTAGWIMATELRALGVDFSFAPVLDLDRGISQVIGDRAFSGDPATVATLGLAWQRGVRAAGSIAIGKHFPGHGGTASDSHQRDVVDNRLLPDLVHQDLVPFRRLIDNGLAGVMMAHVSFASVDPRPAGFAPPWIDYLRRSLGFQGAIFSDDLEMAAAATQGDLGQRADRALAGGCDMVLFGNAGRRIDPFLDQWVEPDPLAAFRLARLHGREGADLDALHASDDYRSARSLLAGL